MPDIHFSWSDGVHAVLATCLPCFTSPPDHEPDYDHENEPRSSRRPPNTNPLRDHAPPPRARPDELEGLLAESDDAETLSLHSNFGDRDRRKKRRRRPQRGIRVFGWDLFGRPPIQLAESDDEDGWGRRERTISSSTLDSDAAPLDSAAINELSAARAAAAAAQAAAEEEHRKAKEERRRLRRERKELKRIAMAMSVGQPAADEEFEGFQGSGAPALPFSGPYSNSDSIPSSSNAEDFGPFAHAQAMRAPEPRSPIEDGADFGAESYTRRAPRVTSSGGSDSRSRTSASNSTSNKGQSVYAPAYLPQPSPLSPFGFPDAEAPKKQRRKGTSSKRSETPSASSLQTSQSPSLPSPPPERADSGHFEGFPGISLEHAHVQEGKEGGFPSAGLLGMRRNNSEMGVFLARRGEE